MARTDRPFVRVYHDDLIRDYAEVWDDDRLLANWLRLLVVADKQWPAPGELPRSLRPRVLADLVKSRILEVLPKHRFTLRGLNAERQRRADSARVGPTIRWSANAGANASTNAMQTDPESESLGSPSRGHGRPSALRTRYMDSDSVERETDGSSQHEDDDGLPDVLRYLAQRRVSVREASSTHTDLARLVDQHGAEKVIEVMDRLDGELHDAPQFVYGARNELNPIPQPRRKSKGYGTSHREANDAFG